MRTIFNLMNKLQAATLLTLATLSVATFAKEQDTYCIWDEPKQIIERCVAGDTVVVPMKAVALLCDFRFNIATHQITSFEQTYTDRAACVYAGSKRYIGRESDRRYRKGNN